MKPEQNFEVTEEILNILKKIFNGEGVQGKHPYLLSLFKAIDKIKGK